MARTGLPAHVPAAPPGDHLIHAALSAPHGDRIPACGVNGSKAPARRPVSRVLYRDSRRGDGHPSGAAGCPTAHAADPRAGQRASPPGEPGLRPPIWPCSGWSLPRFTPVPKGRHRHCGTGPRLTADGRYPPPCAGELGLSSRRPVARRTRDHPAASLARAVYGAPGGARVRGSRTAGSRPASPEPQLARCGCRTRTAAVPRTHPEKRRVLGDLASSQVLDWRISESSRIRLRSR